MIKVWPNIFNKTEPTRTSRKGNKDSRSDIQNSIYTSSRLFRGQLPSAKEDLADTAVAMGSKLAPLTSWCEDAIAHVQPEEQARPCEFPLLLFANVGVYKAQRGTKGLPHMQTGEAGKAKTWPALFLLSICEGHYRDSRHNLLGIQGHDKVQVLCTVLRPWLQKTQWHS